MKPLAVSMKLMLTLCPTLLKQGTGLDLAAEPRTHTTRSLAKRSRSRVDPSDQTKRGRDSSLTTGKCIALHANQQVCVLGQRVMG